MSQASLNAPWNEFTAVGADRVTRHLFLCADQTEPKCVDKDAGLESWAYLKRRLKDLRAQDPERPATIDAYPGTVYEDVIKVLDVVLLADYTDVTFIGARDVAAKK